jgi:hypothetical protein
MIHKLMSKIIFVFVLVLNLIGFIPQSNAGVADCLDVGYPTSYLGTSSLTIEALVNVRCTNEQLGSGSGFVYSVEGESFGAQCSGPNYVRYGSSGTIRCSIPIGSGFGSTRYGATSTTIKIWTAWDFSTKFIYARHQAIPTPKVSIPTPTAPIAPSQPSNPYVSPIAPGAKTNQEIVNEIEAILEKVDSDIDKLKDQLGVNYKLTCKKQGKTQYVSGVNPKCPIGFKQIKKSKI